MPPPLQSLPQRRTARAGFRDRMGRDPGRVNPFTTEVIKYTKPVDKATLFHYWHPDREGVEMAPKDFQDELIRIAGVDTEGKPNALCVRPPKGAPVRCNCWLVFKRAPEIKYSDTQQISEGWFLVLAWNDDDEPHPKPLPLDNRVFANLYFQSLKGGREYIGRDFDSAAHYFDNCMAILDREKAAREKDNAAYLKDRADDYHAYTTIKNIGHGSKFALHHDGTLMPGRGEQNWLRERGSSLPSDVEARDAAEVHKVAGTASTAAPDCGKYARDHDLDWYRYQQDLLLKIRQRASRVMVGAR